MHYVRIIILVVSTMAAAAAGWMSGSSKSPVSLPDPVSVLSPAPAPGPTPLPAITLASVFGDDHGWTDSLPSERTVTLLATGDIIPAREVNYRMVMMNNFRWPYEKTADLLRQADITVINLEAPFVTGCVLTRSGMVFCGDPRGVEGLTYAGVDVAGLGNNHSLNHGQEGLTETVQILRDAGIIPAGNDPEYRTVKGIAFAFLSYNDVGGVADIDRVTAAVREATGSADVVVVSVHWGEEYVTMPTDRQRELARTIADAGADLILGNHPHWIQPVEQYGKTFITYAHGNFIFDQEWSEETKTGVVGTYTFFDGGLVDARYIPVRIEEYGQPYVLEGEARTRVLDGMRTASEALTGEQ